MLIVDDNDQRAWSHPVNELKTEGVIGDYRLVAIPRDNKMIIHINMVSPGHIESFEVTMAAGVI